MHIDLYTYDNWYTHIHLWAYTHICTHPHIHIYTFTYIYTYIYYIYLYIYLYIYIYSVLIEGHCFRIRYGFICYVGRFSFPGRHRASVDLLGRHVPWRFLRKLLGPMAGPASQGLAHNEFSPKHPGQHPTASNRQGSYWSDTFLRSEDARCCACTYARAHRHTRHAHSLRHPTHLPHATKTTPFL